MARKVSGYHQSEILKLKSLLDVSKALSSGKGIPHLLELVLIRAVEITDAEAGIIFLMEKALASENPGQYTNKVLRFYRIYNRYRSMKMNSNYLCLNMDSIAGLSAITATSVRVRNIYVDDRKHPNEINREFDKFNNYRTQSLLTVPVLNVEGKTLGLIQLFNKLRRSKTSPQSKLSASVNAKDFSSPVIPLRTRHQDIIAFSQQDDEIMQAFAAQAAIALENSKLTEDISNLFKSFVKASVTAIEARDPSTSGHSARVAILTVGMAKKISDINYGKYKDVFFSPKQLQEIRYAALLHDFGKIGVRENVLLKAKKFFPHELSAIHHRFIALKKTYEAEIWKTFAKKLETATSHLLNSQNAVDSFNKQIDEIYEMVLTANEPQVTERDFATQDLISKITNLSSLVGQEILTSDEMSRLSIAKGSLTDLERQDMESHALHTYNILKRINWTEELEDVPHIAAGHHEKLDGTGYPSKLNSEKITLPCRIMAITDIYDSLTSMDRPYKRALSVERTLEILRWEAQDGKLDSDLVEVFIREEIFKLTMIKSVERKSKAA